jgi:NAD(P)-dependent dehydrogenase (short-subunit alcohol dehydrogenase family)
MTFTDRVVIVTGGTGALGQAVTRAFLDRGARVAVTYRDVTAFEQLAATVGAAADRLAGFLTDVTDEASVAAMVDGVRRAFGRIDVLANIVGGFEAGSTVETSLATWCRMIDMNLTSVFLCSRAVIPQMTAQQYGRIVNVSSRWAVRPMAGAAAYTAAKAGVIALTQAMAEEVKQANITVNAVVPSTIDTPANRRAMPQAKFERWVKPESVADVILFLASPEARDVSGAAIPVYGKA